MKLININRNWPDERKCHVKWYTSFYCCVWDSHDKWITPEFTYKHHEIICSWRTSFHMWLLVFIFRFLFCVWLVAVFCFVLSPPLYHHFLSLSPSLSLCRGCGRLIGCWQCTAPVSHLQSIPLFRPSCFLHSRPDFSINQGSSCQHSLLKLICEYLMKLSLFTLLIIVVFSSFSSHFQNLHPAPWQLSHSLLVALKQLSSSHPFKSNLINKVKTISVPWLQFWVFKWI